MNQIAKLVWKSLSAIGLILMIIGILTALIGLIAADSAEIRVFSLIIGLFIAGQGAFIVAINEVFNAILDTRDNTEGILNELKKSENSKGSDPHI